jgi:hypothetical protein
MERCRNKLLRNSQLCQYACYELLDLLGCERFWTTADKRESSFQKHHLLPRLWPIERLGREAPRRFAETVPDFPR